MAGKAETRLAPKLRFPEFADGPGWEAKPLDDIIDRISETVGDLKLTPVSISAGKGFVPQAEKFGRDISGDQYSRYIRLRRGDFAYNRGNSKRFPQGCVYQLDEFDEVAASNAFLCFQLHQGYEPDFLLGFFEGNGHGRQLARHITSSARSNGLLNISADTFYSTKIPLPPTEAEQQKIAECLGSLDDLIAAESRKLDALRQHKKGLMQQLFPQPGETVPRLRFPEFQDAGEWEERPLSGLAKYQNGKAYEKHIVEKGKYVVVNSRFISTDGAVRKYTNENFCIAKTGDVLIVLSDLPTAKALARCFIVDKDQTYAVNQRVARIRPYAINSLFLHYSLDRHPHLMAFSDGLNQTHLSKGAVEDCPILLPSERPEQERIANCLGSLDSVIRAKTNQIDALKLYKSGLLQQLFPSLEGQ